MINLNAGEKVVLKKSTNLINGLNQKPGKIYLTNERLIFEDSKNSNNNIYLRLSEIQSYKELKVFYKLTSGIEFYLDNGIQYCFNLFGSKKFLSELEDVKGSSIDKENGIKHHWLPNILFGVLVGWLLVFPTINFIHSSFNSLMFNSNPLEYIENVHKTTHDVGYDFEIDNDVFYLPNLHGEWGFYDDNNDMTFNIKIKLTDYYTGDYEVWTKLDWDEKWKMEEEGKFEIGRSKDVYGDNQILGYRIEDLIYKSDRHDRNYIFSVNSMVGGYGLRLGPRFEVWNGMTGERMRKISNESNFSE